MSQQSPDKNDGLIDRLDAVMNGIRKDGSITVNATLLRECRTALRWQSEEIAKQVDAECKAKSRVPSSIESTPTEIERDARMWLDVAEKLLLQYVPAEHDGRNTWLMSMGASEEAHHQRVLWNKRNEKAGNPARIDPKKAKHRDRLLTTLSARGLSPELVERIDAQRQSSRFTTASPYFILTPKEWDEIKQCFDIGESRG